MLTPTNSAGASSAQRLLEAMHPVCSHDLSNQVVALQSLLQLFGWDEAQHLTAQGKEYLERLNSIASKTAIYAKFLKEIVRLQRHEAQLEKVLISHFFEEFRSEVQRTFAGKTWTWHCQWQVERIDVDRRLLQQGLMHLLRFALDDSAGALTLATATAPQPDHVSWTITVDSGANASAPRSDATLIEQRLALALAQQCLAATNVACRPVEGSAAGATSFALEIPNRSPHG